MHQTKREVDLIIISDLHLGTYGCHAEELLSYLKSVHPKKLILNGDIIDIWQFSKRYWPTSHMKVVKHILGLIAKGVEVVYITGNHDEVLRKFVGFKLGSFSIENKVVLDLDGKSAWCFHGDVFDVTMQHSKWLARLGSQGYDFLILLNRLINYVGKLAGKGPISMSKKIKNSVKSAVSYINDFEKTATDIAILNGYDYVVCGHIHQPAIKSIKTKLGETTYLNSGDWIENLTALEYHLGVWKLYSYEIDHIATTLSESEDPLVELNKTELFNLMQLEFNQMNL
ncbi:UDP-2,3-diacylglucosamine diphosphatase [Anditalea andensis]|uniref:Phosphoesterase n=1 Tax=Anditalea andensis TaxID=1048983 RepID=A0A074L5R1_9BACT|nr:UDP-2,3-diacylglucosamine diphosphatase [Anditalea andensis]KEO75158.1 phosphoesterase [Anditalea andensis]